MTDEHVDDLRHVREGDEVEIATSDGDAFGAECVDYTIENADERTGEVRETKIWEFDSHGRTIFCTILDGLRSSPDDPEFPQHTALWDADSEENLGYITGLRIWGRTEA